MSKRRTFTSQFKAERVLEVLTGVKSQAEVCREHRLKPQLLARWKSQFLEQASLIFEQGQRHSEEAARIAELERVVGRLTLEVEAAKKASSILGAHLNSGGRS